MRLQVFLHLSGRGARRVSRLSAVAAVLVLCAVVPAVGDARAAKAISPCREANVHPSATNIRAADAATLCLVNRMRLAHGLRPLSPNRELDQVAASQVTSMVRWDYFADDRPTGLLTS